MVCRGLPISQRERTHEPKGSCKGRQSKCLQIVVGKNMATQKNARIEDNIWRDRMQYGFELHSCRLGFPFANDRLPQEHRRVAIRVLALPLLNFRGCGFLSHFSLLHHLGSSSLIPYALLSSYFALGLSLLGIKY
ncbi:hypothetical protein SUGI_0548290 [Cryptomeria japonica]|nr:hypothetical protein SUGI_0548290 [Cryptomeria japonica]